MTILKNRTFDELTLGDQAKLIHTITEKDLLLFAYVTGDTNPLHLNESYAKTTQFGQRIVHGMFSASLVASAIGTQLPGPGTIFRGQEMKFQQPVFVVIEFISCRVVEAVPQF